MKKESMKSDGKTKMTETRQLACCRNRPFAKTRGVITILAALVAVALLGTGGDANAFDLMSFRRHQAPVDFGRAALAGEGCRYGDLEIEEIEDGYVLIIVHSDDFKVNQNSSSGSIARERCTWALPVELGSGFSLKIEGVYVEGRARLSPGATAKLNSETFFAGTEGEKISMDLDSSNDGKIQEFQPMNLQTSCGESLNLRQNNSIVLRSADSFGSSMVKITDLLVLAKVEPCE